MKDTFTEKFLQDKIDVPLLLLFTGQFIMVEGLVNTGVPKCFWQASMPQDPLETPGVMVGFVLAILVLSNVISNVPLILMMRPMLSDLARDDPIAAKKAWLMVAFVCK
eukprot:COSAG06_NODE_2794_length_6274_cov_2.952551_7_plen_108_part_00